MLDLQADISTQAIAKQSLAQQYDSHRGLFNESQENSLKLLEIRNGVP